jgi:GT2 family glycosyltransferase
MSIRVTIVVLNWNNGPDTLACLSSLFALAYPACDVLVVDNGSTDDSVARIRAAYPNVTLIETGANLGYAGGNNAGIRHALAHGTDIIGILNNDVTAEPDFLAPLLVALDSRPDIGVVTPLVAERSDDGGRVWALGSTVDQGTAAVSRNHAGEPAASWREQPSFDVDVASGAAMLIKREVFERAGLMDEDFFLYFEEVDWSLAVRRAGCHILAVPASVVWHKVSATLGATSPVVDYYMLRNHLRLIGRHWHGLQRGRILLRTVLHNLATITAYTVKTWRGQRLPSRNARLIALRDALLGRWGKMGTGVAKDWVPKS